VQHPGFVGLALAETQSGAALLLLGSVHNIEALGFLSFIDSDGMSFFKESRNCVVWAWASNS
jgi:hypothetical protein